MWQWISMTLIVSATLALFAALMTAVWWWNPTHVELGPWASAVPWSAWSVGFILGAAVLYAVGFYAAMRDEGAGYAGS